MYLHFMPLIHEWTFKDGSHINCWKLDEPDSFFTSQLDLSPLELEQLKSVHTIRRSEWLASRYLINRMTGYASRKPFRKDSFGKPFLDASELEISISHNRDILAASTALFKCGIDIQIITPKIERIAEKFLSDKELVELQEEDRLKHLHIYWGAKESMYKAYGRKKLTFKRDMALNPFTVKEDKGHTIGYVRYDGHIETYEIHWTLVKNNYVLVYAIQLL